MRVEHIKHHASSLRRFEHDAMRTAMHRLTFDDGIKTNRIEGTVHKD